MQKLIVTLTAASALALGACQSKEASQVENVAEAQSDLIEAQADTLPDGAAKDAAEARAEQVERVGEVKADAIDSGKLTPGEAAAVATTPPAATQ